MPWPGIGGFGGGSLGLTRERLGEVALGPGVWHWGLELELGTIGGKGLWMGEWLSRERGGGLPGGAGPRCFGSSTTFFSRSLQMGSVAGC